MSDSKFHPLHLATGAAMVLCMATVSPAAHAWECSALPSHHALKEALSDAQNQSNGGFGLEMWGAIVDRDGLAGEIGNRLGIRTRHHAGDKQIEIVRWRGRCLWAACGAITPPFPRDRQGPSREDSLLPWMPGCRP